MNEDIVKNEKNRLIELIGGLSLKDSYWGYLFSKLGKKETSFNFPLAVGLDDVDSEDNKLYLYYNPLLTSQFDDQHVVTLLIHEGTHILNKHIPRLLNIMSNDIKNDKNDIREAWNYAADFCVNYINDMRFIYRKDTTQFKFLRAVYHGFPENWSSEKYYDELMKRKEKEKEKEEKKEKNQQNGNDKNDGGGGKGEKNNGEHEKSEQESFDELSKEFSGEESGNDSNGENPSPGSSGTSKSEKEDNNCKWVNECLSDFNTLSRSVEDYIKEVVKESLDDVRDRGNLPGNLKHLIEEALKPPNIPYYHLIGKIVKGSRLFKFKTSYSRINRKRSHLLFDENDNFIIPKISPFPGKTKDPSFKITIVVDTSGSMNKNDIIESLNCIKDIIEKDKDCETTLIQCDTIIHDERKIKRLSELENIEIKGRGGTILFPGVERARDLKSDITLIFTDGYCENFNLIDRSLLPKKMLWILTPNGFEKGIDKVGYMIRIKK